MVSTLMKSIQSKQRLARRGSFGLCSRSCQEREANENRTSPMAEARGPDRHFAVTLKVFRWAMAFPSNGVEGWIRLSAPQLRRLGWMVRQSLVRRASEASS